MLPPDLALAVSGSEKFCFNFNGFTRTCMRFFRTSPFQGSQQKSPHFTLVYLNAYSTTHHLVQLSDCTLQIILTKLHSSTEVLRPSGACNVNTRRIDNKTTSGHGTTGTPPSFKRALSLAESNTLHRSVS